MVQHQVVVLHILKHVLFGMATVRLWDVPNSHKSIEELPPSCQVVIYRQINEALRSAKNRHHLIIAFLEIRHEHLRKDRQKIHQVVRKGVQPVFEDFPFKDAFFC